MNKLKIKLENCYGISELNHEFDFSGKKTFAIYAPNGSMKTSFAKTFLDLKKGINTTDLIFPKKINKRIIKDEMEVELNPESIFVVNSYDNEFCSEKVSTLLANPELRNRHQTIMLKIEILKEDFFKELKKISKTKKNIETELCNIFDKRKFIEVIKEIKSMLSQKIDYNYSKFDYELIFNDKTINFFETSDFKSKIKEYIELYDKLLKNSKFFKNGFNHYKATKLSDELKKDNFFDATHYLNLYDAKEDTRKEIKNIQELNEMIEKEKEEILENDDLKLKFKDIDSKIKNQELERLREFLKENQEIIIELGDLKEFSKKLWVSYILNKKSLFEELHTNYIDAEKDIKEILSKAKEEQESWKEVIDEFNRRFFVPFEIRIGNQEDMILNDEITPLFEYKFKNRNGEKPISKSELMEVLSSGEKKALYLLNIIFEVKARQKENNKTLFIVDDIADSFDYKNKYAIIQYLKEISEIPLFCMIILTHNFDFFRTVQTRILDTARWKNSFMAIKEVDKIKLLSAGDKKTTSPFEYWKSKISENCEIRIACIPLVRNLIEYKEGSDSIEYKQLTSALHEKLDSDSITLEIVENCFKTCLKNVNFCLTNETRSKKIHNFIFEYADQISVEKESNELDLEKKIVLSIGCRLKAEKYMWSKVTNKEPIGNCPTGNLFQRFKDEFGSEADYKKILKELELVVIMTPESIHLNSFMYEPILDMGCESLKELYKNISKLNQQEDN